MQSQMPNEQLTALILDGLELGSYTTGSLKYWPDSVGLGFDVQGFRPCAGSKLPAGDLEFDLSHGIILEPTQAKLVELKSILENPHV